MGGSLAATVIWWKHNHILVSTHWEEDINIGYQRDLRGHISYCIGGHCRVVTFAGAYLDVHVL